MLECSSQRVLKANLLQYVEKDVLFHGSFELKKGPLNKKGSIPFYVPKKKP